MNAVIIINFILVAFLGVLASIPSSLLIVKLFSPQQSKAKESGEDICQQSRADELDQLADRITDQLLAQAGRR